MKTTTKYSLQDINPEFRMLHRLAKVFYIGNSLFIVFIFSYLGYSIFEILKYNEVAKHAMLTFVSSQAFWEMFVFLFCCLLVSSPLEQLKEFSNHPSFYCLSSGSDRELIAWYIGVSQYALWILFIPSLVLSSFLGGRVVLAATQAILNGMPIIAISATFACSCLWVLRYYEKKWRMTELSGFLGNPLL